jgi:hypothetical protein
LVPFGVPVSSGDSLSLSHAATSDTAIAIEMNKKRTDKRWNRLLLVFKEHI